MVNEEACWGDDVLFSILDKLNRFAVIHLTWKGRKEKDPKGPITTLPNMELETFHKNTKV